MAVSSRIRGTRSTINGAEDGPLETIQMVIFYQATIALPLTWNALTQSHGGGRD
jgi:hypothetical protein